MGVAVRSRWNGNLRHSGGQRGNFASRMLSNQITANFTPQEFDHARLHTLSAGGDDQGSASHHNLFAQE